MPDQDDACGAAATAATEVGVILVHGIGEQGRFEHLDAHIRGVIAGLRRNGAEVTVEIMSAGGAAFHSVQDTWLGGPHAALRLTVCQDDGTRTNINVHEVWWADINEPYSFMKQFRFWLWGLSVWTYPGQIHTGRPTARIMAVPDPGLGVWTEKLLRLRLFAMGCIFLLSSLTIGLLTVIAKRLLNLGPLTLVKIFVNYLSSVKLYNQRHRAGAGLGSRADFLDTLDEPPRDSIRRRMIRTICDVSCAPYERWYILAHSLGSVVAFNGLMEPGEGWPAYLDEKRMNTLRCQGKTVASQAPSLPTVPPVPVWNTPRSGVDRMAVFEKFKGLLTYGAPLEKFVAIWPARVPACTQAGFQDGTSWVNVFDPIDAVSGVIRSWDVHPAPICPRVVNIGYAASDVLLLGHIKYLEGPPHGATRGIGELLCDHVAPWLLGQANALAAVPTQERFFAPQSKRASRRHAGAVAEWVAAYVLAGLLAALLVPAFIRPLYEIWSEEVWVPHHFVLWFAGLILATILATFAAGLIAKAWRPAG